MPIFKKNDKATPALKAFIVAGVCVFLIRIMANYGTANSAMLYVAMPFLLSLMLYYLSDQSKKNTWRAQFWNNFRNSMIIMLSVSIVLMEGYVCVLLFLPIYLLMTFLSFLTKIVANESGENSLKALVIPTFVIVLSAEGVTETTSLNRYNEVTYSRVVKANVETIKHRLSQPISLSKDRHWALAVFPMPSKIEAGSLNQGDVHNLEFTYHRWITTNTHKGNLKVKLEEVSDNKIVTSIEDNSYISNYMVLHGTELNFKPLNNKETLVSITIKFDRKLDPIWYFEPLERFAVEKSAKYLMEEIISKNI